MAGHEPIKENLVLTRGADFVAKFMTASSDPDIPAGTTAKIEITATDKTNAPVIATWGAADVTTNTITFRIESAAADAISAQYRYRLLVSIPDSPTLDLCWFYGMVLRMQ